VLNAKANLRGLRCPLNLVKAKLAQETVVLGDMLEIEIDDGQAVQSLPLSLGRQGRKIVNTARCESHFCVRVRRRR
jgi:sulfite reductase (ferredoxin)